ncbi:hypothetical protein [Yoonia sp. R2-816]|uniref:hypothetical protein n=1 Tax=Yoonia sp. R2-816 TaxID=3342638 RepID=UPI00372B5683
MAQPKKLIQFKKLTHGYYTAYSMSRVGMKDLRASLLELEGLNPNGMFQIGAKDLNREAWSEIPTKLALAGMEIDGPFSQMIAQGVVAILYGLWEDHYRAQIASELDCKKNELACDLMGDLRRIRQWIVHANGIADKNVTKLSVLSWPSKRGPIFLGSSEMAELQRAINTMTVEVRP